MRKERSQETVTTRPVERSTRTGARKARRGSPERPRYAEVGRGRTANKKEIKMRRGSRDLMNVETAWDSGGRRAPRMRLRR